MAEREWLRLLAVLFFHAVFFTSGNAQEESRRVLSGVKAKPGQFPSVVLLEFKDNRTKCTGTLVSTKWVLTAAHCVAPKEVKPITITLVAGVVDELRGSQAQTRNGLNVVVHPSFNETTHHFDLALIEADRAFTFTDYVRPIHAIANPQIPKGEIWHCGTVGFGLSSLSEPNSKPNVDELRFQRVTVSDLSLCPLYTVSDKQQGHLICSVIQEGRGICDGDEGAPVVCQGVQVGTMSGIVYTSPRLKPTLQDLRCGVPQDTMKIEYLGFYVDWMRSHVTDLMEPLTLKSDRENQEARSCDEPQTPLQVVTCVLLPLLNMLLMVNYVLNPRWNLHK